MPRSDSCRTNAFLLQGPPNARALRGYALAPLTLYKCSSLQAVFVSTGTLCRPLRCKGRGQVPAQPETGCPLHRTALVPPVRRACGLRTGTVAVASSVVPMACPKPAIVRLTARRSVGASAALVCARPAVGSPFAIVTPLAPMAVAHLTPRSAPPSKTPDVRSLVDRSATPRTCTTRPAARRCRPRRASSPPHRQGIAPIAPRSKPRTQGGPLKKRPQGPGAAAVARALVRPGRSSL